MEKTKKAFNIISWAMIVVGIFTIVTGIISLLGFSEQIGDSVSELKLFRFLDGAVFFILCGVIHIATGWFGLMLKKDMNSLFFIIALGIFTLAWQFAAFVYLLMMRYISLRIALMVILPFVYVLLAFIIRMRSVDAKGAKIQINPSAFIKEHFSIRRKNIGGFSFNFKRKNVGKVGYHGKRRRSVNIGNLFKRR